MVLREILKAPKSVPVLVVANLKTRLVPSLEPKVE